MLPYIKLRSYGPKVKKNNIVIMEGEEEYLKVCEEIKILIQKTGELLEGNCMYKHLSMNPWDCLLNKRKNYQSAVKGKKKICEIGFNAGHSVLAMMFANPEAEYVLFDLGEHQYSKPCFAHIKKRLPHISMTIKWGDSRKTLLAYHKANPKTSFDLLHIDGGHRYEVYSADWENSLRITNSGSTIIFDDTDNRKISAFLNSEIKKGTVIEEIGFLKTYGYEHRIFLRP